MIQIFLSHSSRDLAVLELIRAQAEAIDVRVYLHELHAAPGAQLSTKVAGAIANSDALVVLLTSNTSSSPYVNQEIGFALGKGLPVIPLVTRDLAAAQLAMLEGAEYIVFDPDEPQRALTTLTGQLHKLQETKLAVAHAMREAVFEAAIRRQQEVAIALGFVCALLLLYIATSDGSGGTS